MNGVTINPARTRSIGERGIYEAGEAVDMADRTSARLLGRVFEVLAKNPTAERMALAKELWPLTREGDFTEDQMDCDESLLLLGVARLVAHPDYPGETLMEYEPE